MDIGEDLGLPGIDAAKADPHADPPLKEDEKKKR